MTKEQKEKDAPIPADIAKMNFEIALNELEEIVGDLEQGEVSLEKSIGIYERGTHLKRHCEEKLSAARAQVEKIVAGGSGEIGLEPLESD